MAPNILHQTNPKAQKRGSVLSPLYWLRLAVVVIRDAWRLEGIQVR